MHKNPLNHFENFNTKKIILSDNLFVMYLYRQSLDDSLPFYDASAQGPPPIWNEFKHGRYVGNWRDYMVKGYGWCFYFYTNNEELILQWDLFYPNGAHIHYESNGHLMAPRGLEGDPLDWAVKTLSDQKLLDKQFKINVDVNHMIPLRKSIGSLKRGIIIN